jgi:hypothetical protein
MSTGAFETETSHEEPFAIQFSVFMPNRVGQLGELLDLLAAKQVRLVGVSVVDSTDWAVIRMICTDANRAREVLRSSGHSFTESEVILVELETDNALREVCGHLLRGEINVHFAFPLTIRSHDNAVMALHVDDEVLARSILVRHKLTVLGWEDLSDPS